MTTIEFFYDIVCPYAYLASRQIESIAKRSNATIRWVPVLLGGIYRSINTSQYPAKTWSKSKQLLGAKDLVRQAKKAGINLTYPKGHPKRSVEAMRLLCACPKDKKPQLTHALYESYWQEGRDISDPIMLNAISQKFGLAKDLFTSPNGKQQLYTNTDEAVKRGAFGVPTMFVGEKMWWGQDRLHFVEDSIKTMEKSWPKGSAPQKVMDFYHDFSSPFSYLASTQIESLAQSYQTKLRFKGILLGAIFKQIGTPNVPLFTMSKQKQRYFLKDLHDWANWWNVPFQFPTVFPVRTVLPLRVTLIVPELTHAFYHALWAQNRNIGDPNIVNEILLENNKDPQTVLAQIPMAKEQLRKNTTEALNNGVFGVPSMYVDKKLWWGQDRLFDVAKYLANAQ